MAVATVLSVFGLSWARVLWFPLLFLFFAVPFGDALVPTMMEWTADFTVWALRVTGVPVFREGNHFVIPSGSWSVVEACSGIKFLIASFMAGTLYAWVMYRSLGRRVAFVLASIALPFIANWLRAYLTVLVAHITNNKWMLGIDHLIFGWFLFAAILLGLFWAGARWREDRSRPAVMVTAYTDRGRVALGALVSLLVLVVFPPIAEALLKPVGDSNALQIEAPIPTAGWAAVQEPVADWKPNLTGAAATAAFTYQKDSKRVGLFVATFRHQTETGKLASTTNQFVANKGDHWMQTSGRTAELPPLSAAPAEARAAILRGRVSGDKLAVWQWYWIGDSATASDLVSKLELARARLLRKPDTGLWVAVFTPLGERQDDLAGNEALIDFLRSMDPSLRAAFARTTER